MVKKDQDRDYMVDRIGLPAMLEQSAEEATEFAKAALKMARIIRHENPTPVTIEEAKDNLWEEWSDMVTCASQLHLHPDFKQIISKRERFMKRWDDMQHESE